MTKIKNERERYAENLKLTIMDEVYFVYQKTPGARAIIAEWFETDERATSRDWIKLDSLSISNIYRLMIDGVVIAS